MNYCYTHEDKQSVKKCMYCGKDYCENCLLLHGERKAIICHNCYNLYMSKFKKSIVRRWIYIAGGTLTLLYFLYNIYKGFVHGNILEDGTTLLIGIGLIIAIIINVIRIRQMKKWQIAEKYIKKTNPK